MQDTDVSAHWFRGRLGISVSEGGKGPLTTTARRVMADTESLQIVIYTGYGTLPGLSAPASEVPAAQPESTASPPSCGIGWDWHKIYRFIPRFLLTIFAILLYILLAYPPGLPAPLHVSIYALGSRLFFGFWVAFVTRLYEDPDTEGLHIRVIAMYAIPLFALFPILAAREASLIPAAIACGAVASNFLAFLVAMVLGGGRGRKWVLGHLQQIVCLFPVSWSRTRTNPTPVVVTGKDVEAGRYSSSLPTSYTVISHKSVA
ncbi:hypothetical protein MIND_00549700 [Mycena indigotica]|uniref:Uncharacterized protein n=1 Tax=Mycena indigotica TaxID=2126181 RepID=A0A8H6SY87_9AGAR|nr:uncharacterized protein MIND_00549700 [Mycena indigotica]KAF7307549.1 hypothetical protein MIND_00549700 [Mycena indigotica]